MTTTLSTQSKTIETATVGVIRRAMKWQDGDLIESRPLADWSTAEAYVLLGDPGAGKSWSFEAESASYGGILVPARDIIANIASTDIGNKSVFIDALDEVRSGTSDGRVPFDAIRSWLNQAGRPRFRLSCREADWLGQSDLQALERVAPSGRVEVLHLEPLTRDDVFEILHHRTSEVSDPQAFWCQAERFNLTELFGNPLLLDLTIKAVSADSGSWPSTRKEIYEAACRQLAVETNVEHLAVRPLGPGDIDRILDDVGLLCAILLLSNKHACALQGNGAQNSVELSTLPEALSLRDARSALSSKVFTTIAGHSIPRHRSIAEFLAAKSLARRLDSGLPLGRLLAHMLGFDGRPVESLRGLFAWLVVHHGRDRARLMNLDPIGVVLNGDVTAFSTSERLQLLKVLSSAAREDKGFRRDAWVSHPFGALATADMTSTYDTWLRVPDRDDAHEAFMDCALDALRHGEKMPLLVPGLETWVEDSDAWFGNRLAAYEAWKHNGDFQPSRARQWLEQVAAGTLPDSADRLTGLLLTDLYPVHLGPTEVLNFLHPANNQNLIAEYSNFWRRELLRRSRPQDFAELADAWVEARPLSDDHAGNFGLRELAGNVLIAALLHAGDKVSTEQLNAWLGICLDQYGSSKLIDDSHREVAQWLEARPDRIKAVVQLGHQTIRLNKQGQRFFWEVEQRLHGARKPRDWLWWLLDQAISTTDEELGKDCFRQAAFSVLERPSGFDVPTMEEIENWVEAHSAKWPMVRQWLQDAWTSDVEDCRGDQHRRELRDKAQQIQTRAERKRALDPYVVALASGTAPASVLHGIALAHDKLLRDIYGDTPLERIQDYLVTDEATAKVALESLTLVLTREDIPSAAEILDTDEQGQYHRIRPVMLLAAQRSFRNWPETLKGWNDELAQRLVAFYLTDGTGEMPGWYRHLVVKRPKLVAPILVRYAAPKLRNGVTVITGLWALRQDDDHRELARLVLPPLLAGIPPRASKACCKTMNNFLLGALHFLEDGHAADIVRLKLARSGLNVTQRICWLVAELPFRNHAADAIVKWAGDNKRRAEMLGVALHEQDSVKRIVHCLPPNAIRRLIEVLAPITPRKLGSRSGFVTATDEREDTVRGLFEVLASDPSVGAKDELRALREFRHLGTWREVLNYNIVTQQSVAREAFFQVADPIAVALMIANRAPANAADLQAIVMQHLGDIEAELRGADTFLLRLFWQKNGESSATPLIENDCRDLLLEKLRNRLTTLNINVEREASAAADKRADMRAEIMRGGRRVTVPIEVKKENHVELWTAWRSQLQRLYTIDPAAGGYGMYLVLWFGHKPRSTPDGTKPRNATHLQKLLLDLIPEPDRHRIAVLVLDLSLPAKS